MSNDVADVTKALNVLPAPPISETRSAALLNEEIGYLRNRTRLLTEDVGDLHIRSTGHNLSERTRTFTTESVVELLTGLAKRGFSWRELARMLQISVPALRKWRQGESPSADNRLRLAQLAALVDVLESDCEVSDVASWMEIPILQGIPVTPIDLVASLEETTVVELAGNHIEPEMVLDRFMPSWRDRERQNARVVEAEDGNLSIVVDP